MKTSAVVLLLVWFATNAIGRRVTRCEIPSTCQTGSDCSPGECCREVTCGHDIASYCISAPGGNEQCDPDEEWSCSCAGNLTCQMEGRHSHPGHESKLKKYLEDICKYESHHGPHRHRCPDTNPINGKTHEYVCGTGSGSVRRPAGVKQQCLGDSNCGTGECCAEITCSSIEKNPKVEKVSVCSSIPQSGDPCDLGSMGTALSCPCGQNLSCSHSESTRYGYHREKYYKCLCRYPEDSKKCDKYKNDMRRYQNKPGSVCRETTSTEPVPGQCGPTACGEDQCCLEIACNNIESHPKLETVNVCSAIPQSGDSCDPRSPGTGLACPCGQNLTCSYSESSRYGYYREKYYKCLCKYPDDSKKCDKYKNDMGRHGNKPGSVCRPTTEPLFRQCGTTSCGEQECCLQITCSSIEKKPKVDTLSVCNAIPQEGDSCDLGSMGTALTCPCRDNFTCSHSASTRFGYYRERYYQCLCRYPDKSDRCDRYKKNMEKYQNKAGSVCTQKPRKNLCDSSGCGDEQCCLQITCSDIEKKPRVDILSACSSIPQDGDPCDIGSQGVSLTCSCGQNLTCSHSAGTRYGYHRRNYYKCLCRYPDDSKKCDKYQTDMSRYRSTPGSICRQSYITDPLPGQCGLTACGDGQCCLQIACSNIENHPKVDTVSVCSAIPQSGDPCDPGKAETVLSCSCAQNLTCSSSSRTSRYGYYREKYYKCLCRYPHDSKKCDKYNKNMEKYANNPGTVCRPSTEGPSGQCGISTCGDKECCLQIACGSIDKKPRVDTLSVCSSIPQEGDACDSAPKKTSLTCQCGQNLTCRHSESTRLSYYREKYYRCLCRYTDKTYRCDRYKENMGKYERSAGSVCTQDLDSKSNLCDSGDCGEGECCLKVSCSSIEKRPKVNTLSACSAIPLGEDPCDLGSTGTSLTCPCEQNFTCSHSQSTRYGYHREKYYKCLCRYPDDSKKCEKYQKDMSRYRSEPGSVCKTTAIIAPLPGQCGPTACGVGQCCLQIACRNIEKHAKVDAVNVCSAIPQSGEPCDSGSTGIALACRCGQNLTCSSSSKRSRYEYYREKYYKCLCKYPDDSEKKCEKYKKNIEKHGNSPGSVCRQTQPLLGRCGTSTCDEQECCLQITCSTIEKNPKVDILSVCSLLPQEGIACDPGSTGTSLTCPCERNLTCRHSESTRLSYYREKYYRCRCRYPDKTYRCDRYKENMEKQQGNPGSVCVLKPQPRLNLCGGIGCGTGRCCVEVACQENPNNEFTPDSVAFCVSTPGETETCDPNGSYLCPCGNGLSCESPSDADPNYDPYQPEKDYAECLCNNYYSYSQCVYTPRTSRTVDDQNNPQCKRGTMARPSTQPPLMSKTTRAATATTTTAVTIRVTSMPTEIPTVTTDIPTVTTETPTVTIETPKVTTQTPTVTTETPTATTWTPTVTTETPTVTAETPTATTETPTVITETPTVITETPTVITETPTATTATPRVTTETPIVTTQTPTATTTTEAATTETLASTTEPVIVIILPEETTQPPTDAIPTLDPFDSGSGTDEPTPSDSIIIVLPVATTAEPTTTTEEPAEPVVTEMPTTDPVVV